MKLINNHPGFRIYYFTFKKATLEEREAYDRRWKAADETNSQKSGQSDRGRPAAIEAVSKIKNQASETPVINVEYFQIMQLDFNYSELYQIYCAQLYFWPRNIQCSELARNWPRYWG